MRTNGYIKYLQYRIPKVKKELKRLESKKMAYMPDLEKIIKLKEELFQCPIALSNH